MDYKIWSSEYLSEAEAIKRRVDSLKNELPFLTGEDMLSRERRINMLYSMYLECRYTGKLLHTKAETIENRPNRTPVQIMGEIYLDTSKGSPAP